MKINDKILTPGGIGVIKKIENYPWLGKGYKKRYCVEFNENDRLYCYFEKSVKKNKE